LLARVLRRRPPLPLSWRHILFWGGLRGAISEVVEVVGIDERLSDLRRGVVARVRRGGQEYRSNEEYPIFRTASTLYRVVSWPG
jgi:hypothetical protein